MKDYAGALAVYFGTASPRHFEQPSFGVAGLAEQLHLAPEQAEAAKGILYIISSSSPALEYGPILPTLVALFVSVMGPDDVLGCMASVFKAHPRAADGRSDWAYFPMNRREYLVFESVFQLLLQEHEPALAKHIARVQREAAGYAPDWSRILSRLFVGVLPRKAVKRIVDALVVEGFKVIFRFALAHLHTRRQAVLRAATPPELDAALFGPSDPHCASKALLQPLFARAFDYSLRRRRIQTLRTRAEKRTVDDFSPADRQRILQRPLPKLLRPSALLGEREWAQLWAWVPSRLRLCNVDCIYSTERDGYLLATLYDRCGRREPLLLVARTAAAELVGAFVSRALAGAGSRAGFFGTGETFLFRLPAAQAYAWAAGSGSTAFIHASAAFLAFGAGKDGFGLRIDADLRTVSSAPTETFANPALLSARTAEIAGLEVYAFV